MSGDAVRDQAGGRPVGAEAAADLPAPAGVTPGGGPPAGADGSRTTSGLSPSDVRA